MRRLALVLLLLAPAFAELGTTRVATWRDDRTAAFMLMFDDSWPSHWQVAAPELVKRGLIATFYINPGKGEYAKFAKHWQDELWRQGMVYGDHTMTHKGVKDLADAEHEIGDCAAAIRKILPNSEHKLVSYGQPGVGKGAWNISAAELDTLLKKHHLVSRPTFDGHGAVYHWQKAEQMLALADKAIASRGLEYLVVHGVERITPDWHYQDFWALKQTILFTLLDGLKERSDKGDLWVTDHISAHQYATERATAKVKVVTASDTQLVVEATCDADPVWYDLPLTLVSTVPAGWGECVVSQGPQQTRATAKDGVLRYLAVPNGQRVTVVPAK